VKSFRPGHIFLFANSTGLYHDDGPDRAEVFFLGVTGTAVGTDIPVDKKGAVTFDDGAFAADLVPDTGIALDAFLTDLVEQQAHLTALSWSSPAPSG
jgi:hypothetical protein